MLIVFLRCHPVGDRKFGKADHTSNSIFRNSGKTCNINDPGYPIHIFKTGDPGLIFPIFQSHTAIHISTTITGKRTAFQNRKYQLILFTGSHLIHQIGRRNIRRIVIISHHIFFCNKLIERSIREEIHSLSCPCLCTHNRRLRTGEQFHGTNTPKFFQIIFVAQVIRTCHHKSFQMKQILWKKWSVFFLTPVLCLNHT